VSYVKCCGKYGIVRQVTDDSIVRRMRIVCWVAKATDTHAEYVMLIVFTWQQWLRERTSVLLNAYFASFAVFHFDPQRTQCLLLKILLQCLVVLSAGKFL